MGLIESIQKRGLFPTLKRIEENAVWDLMDAVATDKTPLSISEELPDDGSFPLVDRLFSRREDYNGLANVWRQAESLVPGTYGMRMNVGTKAEGTAHPHFFVVDKTEADATLLFVDPEHYLNRTKRSARHLVREGDVRPKVCNLMAVRLRGPDTLPDFVVTRYRTNQVQDSNDMSFERQLGFARELFENKGLPRVLDGMEEELLFRMVVMPSTGEPMLMQSRYAAAKELSAFLRSGITTPFLEGKRRAFAGLIEEFSAHLKRGEFKPKMAIEKK